MDNYIIDFRSDTVTKPTAQMRRAMAEAEVGDDVYGEDPTAKKLEEYAAEITGKEAALFVTSGTMGNLVALLTHTVPGDEVILEEQSHIYFYEVGGFSRIAGLTPRLVRGKRGVVLTPELIAAAVRPHDIHFPPAKLLCLENTHNRSGGRVYQQEELQAAADFGHRHNLKVHLDGARIFNAAVYLKKSVKEIAAPVDSVMFCLSKGLAAPVGSLLAGSENFIELARKRRKLLGGGLRQVGVLAAAGLVALQTMTSRLAGDHENARLLAEGLTEIKGIGIEPHKVETNMVIADISGTGLKAQDFVERLAAEGVLMNATTADTVRLVTHKDISGEDVETALLKINKAV